MPPYIFSATYRWLGRVLGACTSYQWRVGIECACFTGINSPHRYSEEQQRDGGQECDFGDVSAV